MLHSPLNVQSLGRAGEYTVAVLPGYATLRSRVRDGLRPLRARSRRKIDRFAARC